ncbi:lamin tail domain-containing protein [Chitinophagales bacterium]|nr:lamin tail domain-containing protein [Chitinophagales bacterium]
MKKILLTIVTLFVGVQLSAQCETIFFSEYVEGNGNLKGLEIYNPTNDVVDLSNYWICRYSNGANVVKDTVRLVGMLSSGDVFVVSNGQLLLDNSQGFDSPAGDPAFQAITDQLDTLYSAVCYFNGNDVITLEVAGSTHSLPSEYIDIIGKIGDNPGSGQGEGWQSADGISTVDHTLIRKPNISAGTGFTSSNFDPSEEWIGIPRNTISNIGRHDSECQISSCVAPTLEFYTWCVDSLSFTVRMETIIPAGGDFTFTITDNQGSEAVTWNPDEPVQDFGYYPVSDGVAVVYVTNDQTGGCFASSVTLDRDFADCSFLGIEEVINSKLISVQPNPASSFVNVQSADRIATIELFDLSGRLVNTISVNELQATINVQDYETGIYLMVIQHEDGRAFSDRLIIR